jgi:hypothetical protein
MSRAPANARTGDLPQRGLVTSLAVGAIASAVALPLYMHGLVPLDEGLAVHVAERLAAGEVLYRDVATGVAPGFFWALAALHALLPPTLELGRTFQALLLGVETALVHGIASRLVPPRLALLACALFAGVCLYAYRYPNYSPFAVLFQLLGVLLLLRFARSDSRAVLFATGAMLALCALAKQNYGALAFAAAAVSLALLRVAPDRTGGAPSSPRPVAARAHAALRDGAILAAGALVPAAVALLALAVSGALPMLWQYSVRGVLEGTTAAFTKPYPLLDPRGPFFFLDDPVNYAPFPPATEILPRRAWRPLLVPAVLGAYLVPLGVILAQAWLLARDLARRRDAAARCVLVPGAGLFLLGVLPRADYHHLVLVLPLVWILLADLAQRLPRAPRAGTVALAWAFALVSASAPWTQVLLDTSERLEAPLRLERAPVVRAKEAEVRGLRAAVSWLSERTRTGEPVLVVPRDPLLYFLADRPNASPFPLALPGAFDHVRFGDALERVDTVFARDTAHDGMPLFRLMPDLHEALRGGFAVDDGYLDRLQSAGDPPPEHQPVYALRRREPAEAAAPPADHALLEALLATPPTILNPEAGAFPASPREERRLVRTQWLLEPAFLLRPPSGWQKFAVALRAYPRAGDSLRFSAALRPPQVRERRRGADGAFLEVLGWDEEALEVHRLQLETLDARERGSWRWRAIEVPLDAWAGRDVVVVIAALPGPSLLEVGDEVLVTPPRLVRSGGDGRAVAAPTTPGALEAVAVPSLPGPALDALARFDDPRPFAAALERAGALPAAERARIHLAHGLVLARGGDLDAGRAEVERALSLDSSDTETLLAAAELAAAAGDGEGARRGYAEVLRREPDHSRALAMTVLLALGRGDVEAARAMAQRLERAATSYDSLLVLARQRHAEGDVLGAADALLTAASMSGDTSAALGLLNQWFVGETARVGGALATRAREALPRAAYSAEVVVAEPPLRSAAPGQPLRLVAAVRNRSEVPWPALGNEDGGLRVALGYRWRQPASGAVAAEGRRPLPGDVSPGEETRLELRLQAPAESGDYVLELDMVQEGIAWFGEGAQGATAFPISVRGGSP